MIIIYSRCNYNERDKLITTVVLSIMGSMIGLICVCFCLCLLREHIQRRNRNVIREPVEPNTNFIFV